MYYRDYICGENGILRRWMRLRGISGWRLDVADELPDVLPGRRSGTRPGRLKARTRTRIVLGEVWEGREHQGGLWAAAAVSAGAPAGQRDELPLCRDAILGFVRCGGGRRGVCPDAVPVRIYRSITRRQVDRRC